MEVLDDTVFQIHFTLAQTNSPKDIWVCHKAQSQLLPDVALEKIPE